MTLKTVAERVGVSPMTVSNAFSRPDQLSAALREKILAAAAELGYAGPDPAARTLARGSTGTVGILFHGTPRYALSDEFAALFLAVVAEELGRGGLALTLLPNLGTRGRRAGARRRDGRRDHLLLQPGRRARRVAAPAAAPARARRPAAATTASRASTSTTGRAPARRPRISSSSGTGGSRCSRRGPEALGEPGRLVRPARAAARLARRARARPASRRSLRYVERTADERRTPPPVSCSPARTGPRRCSAFSDALAADVLRAAADLGVRVPADLSVVGLRRLPARAAPHPGADHGAPGRRREGHAGGGGAGGGGARAPRGRARRPAPPAGHRAGGARHHRPGVRGVAGRPRGGRPATPDQMSYRSRFMTLTHAATKSLTNFSSASSLA